MLKRWGGLLKKKISLGGAFGILALLLGPLIFQTIQLIHRVDLSMHPTCASATFSAGHLWFVSYGDGEAHLANQNALVMSALNKGADFYLPYRVKHLDATFSTKNSAILAQKRGAGLWLWKPYVILKALSLMGPTDVLVFADSGCLVVGSLSGLAKRLLEAHKHILVFENFHANGPYIKREALRLMGMDTPEVRGARQLQGGFLVVRNTPESRAFLQEWLEACAQEQALSDRPSKEEYPDFIDHRHDQALLSLVYLKHKECVLTLPHEETGRYFHLHRRRKLRKGSLFIKAYVPQPWRSVMHWMLKGGLGLKNEDL